MAQPLRFSRYEVLAHPDGPPHVLGESTEITIYLAREKESSAPVVLRVPGQAQQKNPAARQRFLEEAQLMAQVKHPHVAAVLHHGDTTAGAFCAMEFCDGLTLQQAIAQVGALPWPEAVRLALQVAGALEELDRYGLVHRGLRPTNLIVTTGGDGHAHLKITDYGRVSEDVIRDTVAATKSGFIQTPAYASPEEFLNIAPPDVRSLQYSLGAVLLFCLTGRPLFEGTQFEVMFHHVNSEPTWSKLPSLPDVVLAVMKRLLAKSAADRFASPAALTAALRRATTGVVEEPGKVAVLDAPSAGPTVLALLKARQTLLLHEVHPLLVQIAEAMDTAAEQGTGFVDSTLEGVLIEIEGWSTLAESQRATLLRAPLEGWPAWKVRFSPTNAAAKAPVRRESPSADFVQFCHRLLTGQGKGTGRHMPTAALSPEGNVFFEQHLGTDAVRGFSCRQLLELLCQAEDVQPQDGPEAGCDPMATRVVRARPASPVPDDVPGKDQQAGHAWLAREREALDRARREMSAQEAERARRMAEEQAHVEKQRRALEEQKALLEEKRREQQRLEQEIQLRAQLEFQKLQEEARSRESQLQHKRVAAEEALRQREAEFRAREQQRFVKLENLKRENDAMEERVQAEYQTLRHIERRQVHRAATPPAPLPVPAAPSRSTTVPSRPMHTQAAGSIVLSRLAPLDTPPATRVAAPSPAAAWGRNRKVLIAVLIGLFCAGILALLGAAALTLFSGTLPENKPAVEARP